MTKESRKNLRRERGAVAVLGAAALVLLAGAGSKDQVPLRRVEVLPARDGVAPGESLSLAVRVTLDRQFHVNSHVPSQEYLIPTRLESEPAQGVEFGEWTYPEGEMKRFPFSDEPLKVYEGEFVIRGSLRAAPDAAEGTRHLTLRLKYQSCTREKCLPPRTEAIPLEVRIVKTGTATRSLHPDLFPETGR